MPQLVERLLLFSQQMLDTDSFPLGFILWPIVIFIVVIICICEKGNKAENDEKRPAIYRRDCAFSYGDDHPGLIGKKSCMMGQRNCNGCKYVSMGDDS
jgi:hypothetical protein